MLTDAVEQLAQRRVATNQRRCLQRQVARVGRDRRRTRCGRSKRDLGRCDKAIAAAWNGRDHVRPEQSSQGTHVHRKVVFLDDDVGPDDVEQLPLGHDPMAPLDERLEHVEGTCADGHGAPVDQQLTLARSHLEAAEALNLVHGLLPVALAPECSAGGATSERFRTLNDLSRASDESVLSSTHDHATGESHGPYPPLSTLVPPRCRRRMGRCGCLHCHQPWRRARVASLGQFGAVAADGPGVAGRTLRLGAHHEAARGLRAGGAGEPIGNSCRCTLTAPRDRAGDSRQRGGRKREATGPPRSPSLEGRTARPRRRRPVVAAFAQHPCRIAHPRSRAPGRRARAPARQSRILQPPVRVDERARPTRVPW